MNIASFVFLLAGWVAAALAFVVLVSHASPAIDFIHTSSTFGGMSLGFGMITHVAFAILLGGVSYLLINAANRM